MTEWQPIKTHPIDRPFLAAQYSPTNWAYRIIQVQRLDGFKPRQQELMVRYCRAWMERPAAPDDYINGEVT